MRPKKNHLMSQLLTKTEVAAYARCTTRCIDNWMKLGYLPYFKIGRTVRFKVSDVDAYLTEHFRVERRSRSAQVGLNGIKYHSPDVNTGNEAVQSAVSTGACSCKVARTGPDAGAMENHFAASAGRTNSR